MAIKEFCALGPVAEAFITGAAAGGATRLPAELAELKRCAPRRGEQASAAALDRAVAFGRQRAADVRSILAAAAGLLRCHSCRGVLGVSKDAGRARAERGSSRTHRRLPRGNVRGRLVIAVGGRAVPGAGNADEHGSGLRSDADGGLIAVEPDGADLDTDADLKNADPGDFGGLDADDAGLQAALTVLAVLGDDISDVAEMADGLVGDAGGLETPGGPEDLEDPETGQPSAEADAEAEVPGAWEAPAALAPGDGGVEVRNLPDLGDLFRGTSRCSVRDR